MILRFQVTIAWLAFAVAGVARAADPTLPCELHVWPAPGMHSTYVGWVHGGTIDGAAKGKAGYPELPADPIGPIEQLAVVARHDVVARLDLPAGSHLVGHEAPLGRRAVAGPERHDGSAAACYAELIVDQIFHEESVASPRTLRVLFRFRSFDGATIARSFTGWGVGRLPPRPDVDAAALTAAFRTGFGDAVEDFVTQVRIRSTSAKRQVQP